MPTKQTELAAYPIKKDILTVAERADKIEVKDEKTMSEGVALLSELNRKKDEITKEKESMTRPLLDALAVERKRWKPAEEFLLPKIAALRAAISKYQTAAKAKADDEAAKIAGRIAPGKGNLSLDTASKKLAQVDRPDEAVFTESGSVNFRTEPRFEVVDLGKLPIEYVLPNEVKIRAAMKAGQELPGIRYYTEEVPINKRS